MTADHTFTRGSQTIYIHATADISDVFGSPGLSTMVMVEIQAGPGTDQFGYYHVAGEKLLKSGTNPREWDALPPIIGWLNEPPQTEIVQRLIRAAEVQAVLNEQKLVKTRLNDLEKLHRHLDPQAERPCRFVILIGYDYENHHFVGLAKNRQGILKELNDYRRKRRDEYDENYPVFTSEKQAHEVLDQHNRWLNIIAFPEESNVTPPNSPADTGVVKPE